MQHITQPTYNRGHTLDLVITYGLSAYASSVVDVGLSDHFCVFFNINDFNHQEVPECTVRKRYLTSEVAASFIELLQDIPPDVLPSSCDFIVDSFSSKLSSALDKVAPLELKKVKTKTMPPWRNTEIIKLKRNCRMAERKWRKTKLTIHLQLYREKMSTYNKAIKHARQAHFSKLIKDKNNPKVLFSTIDLLINSAFNQTFDTNLSCEDFAAHFKNKIHSIKLLSLATYIF